MQHIKFEVLLLILELISPADDRLAEQGEKAYNGRNTVEKQCKAR